MSEAKNFSSENAHVDAASMAPLPNSEKIYITGSRDDMRVPMRKITQAETPTDMGGEDNPPIFVYDTSGPYTDPNTKIDIRKGLAPLRQKWIEERNDTDCLSGPTSEYGQERLADEKLAALRFDLTRQPRKAKQGKNVTQMHYARNGIITPEMEYIAIRENQNRAAYLESLAETGERGERMAKMMAHQHPWRKFWRCTARRNHTGICPRGSCQRPRYYSGKY
jgi:phosphomethylpyrimidine synthase